MPEAANPRTVRTVWLLTSAGALFWLAAIFLAPWLAGHGAEEASRFVYAVFSPICHQMPDRCFALLGHPLAVCGRCLGIYAGFAAGLGLYPLVRGFSRLELPPARVFIPMTLPMALDAAAGLLGAWPSSIGVRFATGFLWGTILPLYFVTGITDFLRVRKARAGARALEKAASKNVQ